MNIETERKLSKFVYEVVHANVGQMVEYILNKAGFEGGDDDAPFSWQDVIEAQNFENLPLFELVEHLEHADGSVDESDMEDALIEAMHTEEFEELEQFANEHNLTLCEALREFNDDHFDIDTVPLARLAEQYTHPEVYEWWIVDRWFASKLSENGEIVIDGNIWGRQCTGQSIVLDGVVRSIYNEINKDGEEISDD